MKENMQNNNEDVNVEDVKQQPEKEVVYVTKGRGCLGWIMSIIGCAIFISFMLNMKEISEVGFKDSTLGQVMISDTTYEEVVINDVTNDGVRVSSIFHYMFGDNVSCKYRVTDYGKTVILNGKYMDNGLEQEYEFHFLVNSDTIGDYELLKVNHNWFPMPLDQAYELLSQASYNASISGTYKLYNSDGTERNMAGNSTDDKTISSNNNTDEEDSDYGGEYDIESSVVESYSTESKYGISIPVSNTISSDILSLSLSDDELSDIILNIMYNNSSLADILGSTLVEMYPYYGAADGTGSVIIDVLGHDGSDGNQYKFEFIANEPQSKIILNNVVVTDIMGSSKSLSVNEFKSLNMF
ncbi:MAG: hypothetical protein ACRCXT_08070 [Paraclostridium sp.]